MRLLVTRAALGAFGFVVLDTIWLGLLMTRFYRDRLAPIARMSNGSLAPNWSAACVVYLLLGVGIAMLALPRAGSVAVAALSGALVGLIVYGVYDFTNYSTLRDWPLALALADTAWGMAASGACAAAVWIITR